LWTACRGQFRRCENCGFRLAAEQFKGVAEIGDRQFQGGPAELAAGSPWRAENAS
jgi:hypothetical protein